MPFEFCHTLAACVTVGAVQEAFRREIVRHGFTNSAVRQVVSTPNGVESRFLFRNWSGEWTRRFPRINLAPNNFAVNAAQRRMTPFTWDDLRRAFSPGEERAWKDTREFGWRNAFVTPVHGPRGYLATISMTTAEADLDWSPAQRLRLQMIALVVHEHARALSNAIIVEHSADSLSARERECLRWVAEGKTDWEISQILSISQSTVKFHLDRARLKLGATTRPHAVAKLVLRGLH